MTARWMIVALLAGLGVVGPMIWSQADVPRFAVSASQFLPPLSQIDEIALDDGGVLRAPRIDRINGQIVVATENGERVLESVHSSRSPQSRRLLLGSDHQGRDIWALTVGGARTSLRVALIATLVTLGLGLVFGLGCALGPRPISEPLTLITDAMLSLPKLVLILCLGAILRGSTEQLALAIGLACWPETARLVASEARAAMTASFVTAARGLGAGWIGIATHHVTGQVLPVLRASAPLIATQAILLEATLAYLGLGTDPLRPSWGRMIADGQRWAPQGWWVVLFPGVLLVVTALAAHSLARSRERHVSM